MSWLARHPQLAEAGISLAILLGSFLAARVLAYALARLAARSATRLDDHLVSALQNPLAYSLFLAGAWSALHRMPLPPAWTARLDTLLYVLGVVLLALALVRSYGILMGWYTTHSPSAAAGGPAREFGPLFDKLGKGLLVLLAVIAVLQHVGVNVASLVVSLGVGSLAVGLAAQDTLANMFAGFTLMLDRPFRIGDRIQLASGELGDVQAIGMRATLIRTLEENVLVIPNSVLVKERLVNQSRPTRQIQVKVRLAVALSSDLALVKRALLESAAACECAAAGADPVAAVTGFADSAVELELQFLARDYTDQARARGLVYEDLARRLAAEGIEVAVPTRRILREAEDEEGAA